MSFTARVLDELRKMVLEEAEATLNILSTSGGVLDFASYKEQVGRLYAYRRVVELFDEAVEKVEKAE
jgi:hypothetical protein